ncbi:MAG: hypothetical protein IJH70_10245 [Oscillospiraceae bacterium]|nr:hypothetical protein [Oscillospiraceae bacterium]
MDTIIHNRIRCKKCGEIIESHTVHEFKWCSCGAVAVDGGKDYLRRCGNREDYEDLYPIVFRPLMDENLRKMAKLSLG